MADDAETARSRMEGVIDELVRQVNLGRTFDELFDAVYGGLRGVVPYNRIGVALLHGDGSERVLRTFACRSDGPLELAYGYEAPVAGSTLAPLLETGEPRILNDLEAYLAAKPESESTRLIVREGMRSSLTLPLLADGRPIGVVFFSSRRRGAYGQEDARLLGRLAGHLAIAVEKALLISRLERRNEELAEANKTKDRFLELLRQEVDRQTEQLRRSEQRYRLLVKLGQIVNSSLDPQRVFRCAADQVRQLFGCDYVALLLTAGGDGGWCGWAVDYADGGQWADPPREQGAETAARWVLRRGVPRVARRLDQERTFPEDRRLYAAGFRSYALLPLHFRNRPLGVFGLAARAPERPDGWDFELLGELCNQLAAALDNAAAYGEIARLKAQLEEQNVYLRDEIKTSHDVGNIVGASPAMEEVRRAIRQVARTDSTVLVLGETGTGKELIARAIHELSERKDKLLVKVNCAALAPGVITSELFGHEAGAFTGAAGRRQGRFEIAQGGSIFLDEIAEIPAETQVMLLRVLQERVIERVGGNEPIEVDVRVIAATNRDLKQCVEQGRFREDLFYRLHVFPIRVPPLRERREDIPALINHFLGRLARRMNKQITRVNRRTMELLMRYDWPGNVRELEHVIERAMIVSRGDTLEIDATWLSTGGARPEGAGGGATLADLERRAILDALEQSGGRVYGPGGAAARLGLKPTTLYGKMRKHGIARRRPPFAAAGD